MAVTPEHAEDTAWATAKMNFGKQGTELLVQRARGSQDSTAPSQSSKEPKWAREDITATAASEELSAPTSTAKKAKQEEDLDAVAARLGMVCCCIDPPRWNSRMHVSSNNCGSRRVTSEGRLSRVMTRMLMKTSNCLQLDPNLKRSTSNSWP